jgi:DNA mismatch endonuclease, patch repair protein
LHTNERVTRGGRMPGIFIDLVFIMADVHSKAQRSYNMSRIRSMHTKPEILVRKFLHANGFRFRLHDKKLPGRPDIVLPRHKTLVFIHGCFWHGHESCKYYVVPKTRTGWWLQKINTNKLNDVKALKALKKAGWKIITVWECDLKPVKLEKTLQSLLKKLNH